MINQLYFLLFGFLIFFLNNFFNGNHIKPNSDAKMAKIIPSVDKITPMPTPGPKYANECDIGKNKNKKTE